MPLSLNFYIVSFLWEARSGIGEIEDVWRRIKEGCREDLQDGPLVDTVCE